MSNNNSRISDKDLNKILKAAKSFRIKMINEWVNRFGEISYYE